MTSIQQGPGQLMTVDHAKRMMDQQLFRPNLAGNSEVAQRAEDAVDMRVRQWESDTEHLHSRWRATHYMLTGNSLERGGPVFAHIPELYKMVETIVPRLEEALLDLDPWFAVRGRDKHKQQQAEALAALFDLSFDQNRFRTTIQSAGRDMLVCQAAWYKLYWDRKIEERVIREVDRVQNEDGSTSFKRKKPRVEEQIVFNGARICPVDPFDMVFDTTRIDPQEMNFIGDRRVMRKSEVLQMGEMMGWANLDTVAKERGSISLDADQKKWPRDPIASYGTGRVELVSPHSDDLLEVYTLYVRAALEDKRVRDYQIVVVEGTAVSVRRNPHDDGLRPYACMRAVKGAHHFFGTGHLDNAVRINQQLDKLHMILMRGLELGILPFTFTGDDADMPDSLYKVQPGEVFKGVGEVRFQQIQEGSLVTAQGMVNILARNIEETVGAFKIQMGQPDSTGGTATEASLSLQEGNRRLRSLVRGVGDGIEQILRILLSLHRQHMDQPHGFRVLGKRAKFLKADWITVEPDTLQSDYDFEIIGLRNLNSYGVRSHSMAVLANGGANIMAQHPDRIDSLRFFHLWTKEMLGQDIADEIVKVPQDPETVTDVMRETMLLASGAAIDVHDLDDHAHHKVVHQKTYDAWSQIKDFPRDILVNLENHIAATDAALAAQQAMEREMEKRQEMAGMGAGGEAAAEGEGRAPRAGESIAGQRQGENPGPRDASKVARGGRELAYSQETAQ